MGAALLSFTERDLRAKNPRKFRREFTPGVTQLLHSATIAVAGQVPVDRLWHAVPCFPTISELWLRLLEAYRDSSADDN
jgi:hypothetical protein